MEKIATLALLVSAVALVFSIYVYARDRGIDKRLKELQVMDLESRLGLSENQITKLQAERVEDKKAREEAEARLEKALAQIAKKQTDEAQAVAAREAKREARLAKSEEEIKKHNEKIGQLSMKIEIP